MKSVCMGFLLNSWFRFALPNILFSSSSSGLKDKRVRCKSKASLRILLCHQVYWQPDDRSCDVVVNRSKQPRQNMELKRCVGINGIGQDRTHGNTRSHQLNDTQGLWWIILLRAYGKCTGDLSVQERVDVQTGIKMILKLCLADGFDMFPTLLVTDGSCMIDRRMGIHGHPLEIQTLFYSALLSAREMLIREDASADLITALNNRLVALSFHVREYYWIDMRKLNEIYRYKTEEYSYDAVNKFNIYPDQMPPWLVEWMPNKGGYMIGNLQPTHMDFRFFSLGNLWSIVSSLATNDQSHAILDLYEAKWAGLIGDMPLKLCYPALEGQERRIITGSDPKNTPWSYHNGGSWPTLLWQFPRTNQEHTTN